MLPQERNDPDQAMTSNDAESAARAVERAAARAARRTGPVRVPEKRRIHHCSGTRVDAGCTFATHRDNLCPRGIANLRNATVDLPIPVRLNSLSGSNPPNQPHDNVDAEFPLDDQPRESPSAERPETVASSQLTSGASRAVQQNGSERTTLTRRLSGNPQSDAAIRVPTVLVQGNTSNTDISDTISKSREKYQVNMACQSNLDFMHGLSPDSMKLIVTSPPYNIGKEYETRKRIDTYIKDQQKVVNECVRILHPHGSMCWQVGNYINDGEVYPLDILLYDIFKDAGLKLRNRIVWQFDHGLHCKKRLSGRYETILWFTKSDQYTFSLDPIRIPQKHPKKRYHKGPNLGKLSCNPLGKNPGDVWNIPNVKHNHVEKTSHPCQFPIELVERLVLSLTDSGDNVFDPYMGVGSSVLAAVIHDRSGFGCDIVPEYVDTAWKRLHKLQEGRLRMRPMNRPIYEPQSA